MYHHSTDFKNLILKPISKYLKKTFCIPKDSIQDKSEIKLKKNENLLIVIGLLLILLKIIIEFLFGVRKVIQVMQMSFLVSLMLLLMKNQYHSVLKMIIFLACSILPYLRTLDEENEYKIFRIPFIAIQAPVYCYLLTRSGIYTCICIITNMIINFYIFIPRLKIIFEIKENDPRALLFDDIAQYVCMVSIVMTLIVSSILGSRAKTIIKLLDQQKVLQILNLKLKKNIEEKDNFLLSVSHDFRNPLNGVSGNIDLVNTDLLDAENTKYFKNAKINVELLIFILNNLMDSAKLQKQNLALNIAPTNMKNLFESSWSTSALLIQKKDFAGAMYISKNMPDIMSLDEIRVKQVIYNLVSNAVKYTDNGYVCIICTWIPGEKWDDSMTKPTEEKIFRTEIASNLLNFESTLNPDSKLKSQSIIKFECENSIFRHNPQRLSKRMESCNLGTVLINEAKLITDRRLKDDPLNENKKSMKSTQFLNQYIKLDFIKTSIDTSYTKLSIDNYYKSRYRHGFLKIEVLDSGTGIPEEKMKDLFQKFNSFSSDKNKKLGVGLGLWISQNLYKRMNGDIYAHSHLKHGSSFVSYLTCEVIKYQ